MNLLIFRTDRTLDLMNQLIYEDINFEMCCIMFNIGVAHAQIAANEIRTEMDVKNIFRNLILIFPFLEY